MGQTWNNAQACKQCLCKFNGFGVKFSNVPVFYIGNAQKGLCTAKFAQYACVSENQYSMSDRTEASHVFLFSTTYYHLSISTSTEYNTGERSNITFACG